MNPSEQIDKLIAENSGWKGEFLITLRKLIHDAEPEVKEEWKWGTAVFSKNGLACAISPFKEHVKINFFRGSSIEDPKKLFNAGLDAKAMRSIDFHEGEKIDEEGLKELISAAVKLNK